jgi:hypothetical protein
VIQKVQLSQILTKINYKRLASSINIINFKRKYFSILNYNLILNASETLSNMDKMKSEIKCLLIVLNYKKGKYTIIISNFGVSVDDKINASI